MRDNERKPLCAWYFPPWFGLMHPETPETQQPLRYGYTTGACATAASVAAAYRLLAGNELDQVEITLPRGQEAWFRLEYCRLNAEGGAEAATVKDAGDDPDVTHGALIFAQVISSCKFSCDAILAYTNKEKSFNFNVENNYAYY